MSSMPTIEEPRNKGLDKENIAQVNSKILNLSYNGRKLGFDFTKSFALEDEG